MTTRSQSTTFPQAKRDDSLAVTRNFSPTHPHTPHIPTQTHRLTHTPEPFQPPFPTRNTVRFLIPVSYPKSAQPNCTTSKANRPRKLATVTKDEEMPVGVLYSTKPRIPSLDPISIHSSIHNQTYHHTHRLHCNSYTYHPATPSIL